MAYAFTRQAGPKGPDKTHYHTFYGPLVLCHGPEIWKKTRVSFFNITQMSNKHKKYNVAKVHSLSQFYAY